MKTPHLTILPPQGPPRLDVQGVNAALNSQNPSDRTGRVHRTLALELYSDASIVVNQANDPQIIAEELMEAARFLIPECPDVLPRFKLLAHRSVLPMNEHAFVEQQIHKALLANGYVCQPGSFAMAVAVILDDGEPTLNAAPDQVYVYPTPHVTCSARDWVLLWFLPANLGMPAPRITQRTPSLSVFHSPFHAADALEVVSELQVNGQDVPWWFAQDDTLLLRGPVEAARTTLREHGSAMAAAWLYGTVARRGIDATYDEEGGELHSDRIAKQWSTIFLERYAPDESTQLRLFQNDQRHTERLRHVLAVVQALPETLAAQAGLDTELLARTITQRQADLDEQQNHLPKL